MFSFWIHVLTVLHFRPHTRTTQSRKVKRYRGQVRRASSPPPNYSGHCFYNSTLIVWIQVMGRSRSEIPHWLSRGCVTFSHHHISPRDGSPRHICTEYVVPPTSPFFFPLRYEKCFFFPQEPHLSKWFRHGTKDNILNHTNFATLAPSTTTNQWHTLKLLPPSV